METPARDLRGSATDQTGAVLELVATALEQDGLRGAAMAVATELAARHGLERVSIGWLRRRQARVVALSHSARFDARSSLLADLAAAMEEACDQDETVALPAPAPGSPRITHQHGELLRRHGAGAACTIPLVGRGQVVGALTLESAAGSGIPTETIRLAENVATLLGPILDLAARHERSWSERIRESVRSEFAKLVGPHHATHKVVAAGLAIFLVALAVIRVEHRVVADATLEGRVQRAIVVGIDGYVAEAHARAGDLVREGQVLGRLDDRDLLIERRTWWGKREQLRREYREALAGHDRIQLNIVAAKLAQAEAQLDLAEAQLARTQLVAPFDGVVVKGDLSQSLGSPVEKGTVLFEVAPLDGYRIILEVDERDVPEVERGAWGRLVLAARPREWLPLTVERVTPVSVAEDGRNFFRVEARLHGSHEGLRPGMEGVAKVAVGQRPLVWVWTHRLVDWIRLRLWSWVP